MGPTWGPHDPSGPHVVHVNFAIWDSIVPTHCLIHLLRLFTQKPSLSEYTSNATPAISQGLNETHSILISKWNCDSLEARYKASSMSILCNGDIVREIALGFHYNFKTQYLYTPANFTEALCFQHINFHYEDRIIWWPYTIIIIGIPIPGKSWDLNKFKATAML